MVQFAKDDGRHKKNYFFSIADPRPIDLTEWPEMEKHIRIRKNGFPAL